MATAAVGLERRPDAPAPGHPRPYHGEARRISRDALSLYLTLPNYTNNLRRLGFSDADLADGGSDHLVDSLVAWGTDDAIARRIADHHAAGADHVGVQALHDGTAVPDQEWRRLAALLQL